MLKINLLCQFHHIHIQICRSRGQVRLLRSKIPNGKGLHQLQWPHNNTCPYFGEKIHNFQKFEPNCQSLTKLSKYDRFELIQFDPVWSKMIKFDPIWSNIQIYRFWGRKHHPEEKKKMQFLFIWVKFDRLWALLAKF